LHIYDFNAIYASFQGVAIDIDMGFKFEFCEGCPSDGACPKMIANINHALWKFFMKKRDLHPLYFRWFLLLLEFEFEVCKKGSLLYGLARGLTKVLLGRQPKVLFLFLYISFLISFRSVLSDLFPFLVFSCLYMFTLRAT